MSSLTILIIVVVILLCFGGGWYGWTHGGYGGTSGLQRGGPYQGNSGTFANGSATQPAPSGSIEPNPTLITPATTSWNPLYYLLVIVLIIGLILFVGDVFGGWHLS